MHETEKIISLEFLAIVKDLWLFYLSKPLRSTCPQMILLYLFVLSLSLSLNTSKSSLIVMN